MDYLVPQESSQEIPILKKWIYNKIESGNLFIEDISAAENEIIIEKMVKSSLRSSSFQKDNKELRHLMNLKHNKLLMI